jgi:hypothetical protein
MDSVSMSKNQMGCKAPVHGMNIEEQRFAQTGSVNPPEAHSA